MPFSIRPYRRILKLLLAYVFGFGSLITFLVLSSGPAYAEWVEVMVTQTDPALYVDPATIHRNGNMVKWWELLDFKTVQTVEGLSFLSMKTQREFDCAEEQARTLAMTHYSSNMGRGTVIHTDSIRHNWESVVPDSLGQAMWKAACGKK